MKRILIFGLTFSIILLIIFFYNTQSGIKTKNISFNGHQLDLEVANTESLRTQGLSGRKTLVKDHGMLFIFPTVGIYHFWMKEMNFPLDFIWINDNKVVDLTENVSPPKSANEKLTTFTARYPFDQVIELNAGTIKSLNIHLEDKVY